MELSVLNGAGKIQPVAAPVDQNPRIAEHRELIQAVKSVNASESLGLENELSFMMDRETGHPVIRIVDRKTKEVIRQLPPEYVLRLAKEVARK